MTDLTKPLFLLSFAVINKFAVNNMYMYDIACV